MNKKLFITLIQKSIYIFLGLVNMLMLAKILGSNQFGIYTYLLTITTLISVLCHQGFPLYSTRIFGKLNYNKSVDSLKSYVNFSEKQILIWSIFVGLCFSYFINSKGYSLAYELILLFSLVIFFMASSQNRAGILRGLGFVPWAYSPEQIIRPLVIFISVYLMWAGILKNQLSTALIAYLFATFLSFFAGYLVIRYKLKFESKKKLNEEPVKIIDNQIHRAASLRLLQTAILFQLLNNIDILLIGQFLTYSDVALYKLCLQAAFFSNLICQAYGQISAHKFTTDIEQQSNIELNKIYSQIQKKCIIFTIPLIIIIVAISPLVINFAIEESYNKAFLIVMILACGQFSNSIYGPAALFLNMQNQTKYVNSVTLFVVIIFCFIGFICVYYFGLIALTICVALGFHLWNYLLLKKVRLYLNG